MNVIRFSVAVDYCLLNEAAWEKADVESWQAYIQSLLINLL